MSKIIGLGIAKNSNQKIEEVSKVELIAGKGITGDRHFHENNSVRSQITLIESENIDYYNNKFKTNYSYLDFRRNVVTKGIELNNLVGKKLSLPAYEQVLKAAHTFNLLDARGVIGVTERAEYIAKIRNISRDVAKAYLDSRMVLGFPLAERGNAEEVIKVMKNAEK